MRQIIPLALGASLFVGPLPGDTAHSAPLRPGADRKARIQADIRRYGSACGCELGSLFMIAATVLFLVYFALAPDTWSAAGAFWRGAVWVLSVAVVGKILGLAYARVRLRMLRSELRREL